jgi:hypothetical protein
VPLLEAVSKRGARGSRAVLVSEFGTRAACPAMWIAFALIEIYTHRHPHAERERAKNGYPHGSVLRSTRRADGATGGDAINVVGMHQLPANSSEAIIDERRGSE